MLNVKKEKIVLEDIQFGVGTIEQSRGTMLMINGGIIPYNSTKSINQELDSKSSIAYVDAEIGQKESLGGDNTSTFKALNGSADDDVVTVAQLTALEEAVYSITAMDDLLLLKANKNNTMLLDGSTPDPEYSTATRQVPANKGFVLDTVLDIGAGDMAKAVYDQNANGRVDTTDGIGVATHSMGITPYNQVMRLSQGTLLDCNNVDDVGIFLGVDPTNAPTGGAIGLEQFDAGGYKAQRAFSFVTSNWYYRIYNSGSSTWSVWSEFAVKADITTLQNQIDSNDTELATKLPKDGSEDMTGNLEAPSMSIGEAFLSPYSHKNKLINGGFDIWQRGTATIVGAGQVSFFADRWLVSLSGDSNAVYGSTNVVPFNNKKTLVLSIDNGGTPGFLQLSQKIEAGTISMNSKLTLSGTFRGYSESGQVPNRINRVLFRAYDASDVKLFEEDVTTIDYTPPSGTGWEQKTLHTFTTPNTNVGAISYWRLYIIVDVTIDNSIIEFAEIQLEEGLVATPFEQRPIGYELSLCQRYYQINPDGVRLKTYTTNASVRRVDLQREVEMRTAPTETQTFNGSNQGTPASQGTAKQWKYTSSNVGEANELYVSNATADAEL